MDLSWFANTHIETRKIKDDYGVHIQDDLVISFPRKRVEV